MSTPLPDAGDLVERFPEFVEAGADLITLCIGEAARAVSESVWQDRYLDGVMLRAAHLLAMSNFGQGARLSSKEGETTYGKLFEMYKREVTFGVGRVL